MAGKPYTIDKNLQSAAGATGDGTPFEVAGCASVGFQMTGTFVGTVTFECRLDGSTWDSLECKNVETGAKVTTATAPGTFTAAVGGIQEVQARVSAWTSGSITVDALATESGGGGLGADVDLQNVESITLAASSGTDVGSVGYRGYTTAKSGIITVTTAGTAVVGSTEAGSLFCLKAHPDNTDTVWVGQDGAGDVSSANGFPLDPGETIVLNMGNLNQVYFDADVSTEKVCWIKLA